jgi:hypothetical protein
MSESDKCGSAEEAVATTGSRNFALHTKARPTTATIATMNNLMVCSYRLPDPWYDGVEERIPEPCGVAGAVVGAA